mgnify:CR=1 FL=1
MKRHILTAATLVFALAAAFAAGGCAKKQVRQEAELAPAPAAAEAAPAPAPRPTVREEAVSRPAPIPAPPDTAAVAPAPPAAADRGLARETTPGLSRIHFDFDQSLIRTDMRPIMQRNYDYLLANPGARIRIEGHCDERGTNEYNLALGERRARAAFQYLMDLGVDPNRMTVVSYGEEVPLDPRHNEEAWALNRRAEFVEIQR